MVISKLIKVFKDDFIWFWNLKREHFRLRKKDAFVYQNVHFFEFFGNFFRQMLKIWDAEFTEMHVVWINKRSEQGRIKQKRFDSYAKEANRFVGNT